jgi:hypothetical protein
VLAAIQFRIFRLFCPLHENVNRKSYKTIILFVVLCGFETWPVILKEEHVIYRYSDVLLKLSCSKPQERIGH